MKNDKSHLQQNIEDFLDDSLHSILEKQKSTKSNINSYSSSNFGAANPYINSYFDDLVEQSKDIATVNARVELEQLVMKKKVLEGTGQEVSKELEEQINEGVQKSISVIDSLENDANDYVDMWCEQKDHIGIKTLDKIPDTLFSKEMGKRQAPIA